MKTGAPRKIFEYADLDLDHVDATLARDGELLVSLPEPHAHACIVFIETVRAIKDLNKSRSSIITRCVVLAKGFKMTLQLLLAHRRLFQLGRVVIHNSSSQTWEQKTDHSFLFRFTREQPRRKHGS